MKQHTAIRQAVSIAGNMSKLARILGVSPQAVRSWVLRGEAPAVRCKSIEKATGVKAEELRPDVFK